MRITNFIRALNKKTKIAIVGVLAIVAVAAPAVVLAGFGPERPVYDYNKACNPNDNDPYDRCGSLDGPVFNSFINTPHYGDERNFVRVAPATAGQAPNDVDYTENVAVQPGKEYWVRTFVHNNANQSTNESGKGIAKDVHVKLLLPTEAGNGADVMTHITSSNAKQKDLWDTGTLVNNSRAFNTVYVPGSAKIYNQAHVNGMALNDDIMTAPKGAKIGYNQMDGNLPGCFEFSAYVYVKVKIEAPKLEIQKRVTTPGSTNWQERLTAKKGDTVSWLINFDVKEATAHDVTIRDVMPKGVTLVPGSIMLFTPSAPNGVPVPDNGLSQGGVNVGNYQAGSGGAIRFRTTVDQEVPNCMAKNVAFGRAKNVPETSDDAEVVVEDCQPPVENPVYACDALSATKVSRFEYKFNAKATAKNGAEIVSYTYDFGDNTTPLTTDKDSVNHTYAKPGEYATKVTVNVDVNGETKSDSGEECMVTINIPKKPTTPETPKQPKGPKELPNTGMGAVAGIFGAVTAAGTAAHAAVNRRRR